MGEDIPECDFDFEKLPVYRNALDFADLVFGVCKGMGGEYGRPVADRLRNAAVSIGTEIAEGCGKVALRDKIRCYARARDAAEGCIPPLTIARRQGQLDEKAYGEARAACAEIRRLLGEMIKTVEDQELKKGA